MDITINSGDSGYIDFYAYGFDETEFKRGYDRLKADSLQVERFTDTEISGTVNAAENRRPIYLHSIYRGVGTVNR